MKRFYMIILIINIMNQINFRINDEGYIIIKEMAEHAKISIAELSKQLVLESLKEKQLKLAIELFKKGKIGLKRAWKLSGLTPFEFRRYLIKNDIEPFYDEKLAEISLESALSVEMKELLNEKR